MQCNTMPLHSVESLCRRLYADVNRFSDGTVPADAITIMAIRLTGTLPIRPSALHGNGGAIIFTSTGWVPGRGCRLGAPPLTVIKSRCSVNFISFSFSIFALSAFPTISALMDGRSSLGTCPSA